MKKVEMYQYEKGDHVMVTHGYNKGKVGTVIRHPAATANVIYELAGHTYGEDSDDDDWDYDDDDYYGEYEDSQPKFLKYITKKEYEDALKNLKVMIVPGLPVGVRFQGTNLVIGDNVITATNAKALAEFITKNTTTPKKTRRS